jgi:low temperature requirement protein LtrA
MSGPLFFGTDGWKLVPGHFAERHGLILLIAIGESIVAIGVGAEHAVDAGVIGAAVLGTAVAAALWWLYFDVVAIVAARRLARATVGREQNAMARDSYSYLHLPMVVGIVLVALGMKKTLGHVEDPLKLVPAFALLGGTALYLFAHVAFRYRHVHTLNTRRLACAVVLVALLPAAVELPAIATLAILVALLVALIVLETISYGESRNRVRHEVSSD